MSESGVDTGAQLSKKDLESALNKGGPELPTGVVEGSVGIDTMDNELLSAEDASRVNQNLLDLESSLESAVGKVFKKSKEVGSPTKSNIESLSSSYIRSLGDKPKK